jgi:hypothetical protein
VRRYGLRDDQWDAIKDLLPGREGSVGVNTHLRFSRWAKSAYGSTCSSISPPMLTTSM